MRIIYNNDDSWRVDWVKASFSNYLQERLFMAYKEARLGKRKTRD